MKHLQTYQQLFELRYARSSRQTLPKQDALTMAKLVKAVPPEIQQSSAASHILTYVPAGLDPSEQPPTLLTGGTVLDGSEGAEAKYYNGDKMIFLAPRIYNMPLEWIASTLSHEFVHYFQDAEKYFSSAYRANRDKKAEKIGWNLAYYTSEIEIQAHLVQLYQHFEHMVEMPDKQEDYRKWILSGDLDKIFMLEENPPVPLEIQNIYNLYISKDFSHLDKMNFPEQHPLKGYDRSETSRAYAEWIRKSGLAKSNPRLHQKIYRSVVQTLLRITESGNDLEGGSVIKISSWIAKHVDLSTLPDNVKIG